MKLQIVNSKQFSSKINEFPTIYHTVEFNEFNKHKCDEIIYVLFKDSKYRGGIILGRQSDKALSPFSAPFGGLVLLKNSKPSELILILQELYAKLKELGLREVTITIPPIFYNSSLYSLIVHSFFSNGVNPFKVDINHHLDIQNTSNLSKLFNRNARRNLRTISKADYKFSRATTMDEAYKAYKTLEMNRESKNRELKLSFDESIQNLGFINGCYFLIKYHSTVVCSALVHEVCPKVAQVVYWGHNPNHFNSSIIYLLVLKVFEFYKSKGIEFLDIGPCSQNSKVDEGLFFFKTSIGCKTSLKYTFNLKIHE